jgi:ABC-2 type transporter
VTTGLDAYNAYNVVESLVRLARDYRRTVIFTIHQPRSNIVTLFDQLILLAAGRTVYSGPFDKCVDYFDSIGRPCPVGFNVADYLIDISAEKNEKSLGAGQQYDEDLVAEDAAERQAAADGEEETELRTRPNSLIETGDNGGQRRSRIARGLRDAFTRGANGKMPVPEHLLTLFEEYQNSGIAADLRAEVEAARTTSADQNGSDANGDQANGSSGSLKGYRKAGLWTQFTILSGRAFKNLVSFPTEVKSMQVEADLFSPHQYRNPLLMLAHYAMAALLALFCGLLYHGMTLDISGFQGRLGFFFFVLALFGFSCLTSLGVFASERALFVKERANGYYSPVTYFVSKVRRHTERSALGIVLTHSSRAYTAPLRYPSTASRPSLHPRIYSLLPGRPDPRSHSLLEILVGSRPLFSRRQLCRLLHQHRHQGHWCGEPRRLSDHALQLAFRRSPHQQGPHSSWPAVAAALLFLPCCLRGADRERGE